MKSALLIFLFSSVAWGQALPLQALSGDPLSTTLQLDVAAPALWTERSDESVLQSRLDAFLPFAQSDVDAYALQVRAHRLRLDRDRITAGGTTGTPAAIPQDLGSASLGLFAKRVLQSKDVLAGDVSIGRSGTRLFANDTTTTVSSTVFWGRPKQDDGGQWIYILSYSNSRSTFNNIPLPGFAYARPFTTESGKGTWAAGAPFFFVFFRGSPWGYSALLSPFTAYVEGSYSLFGPFGFFLRTAWVPQAFKVSGGPEERILYEEFRTQFGFRGAISKSILASIAVSYADGRRAVWGDSLARSSGQETRLDDELSLFTSFTARF